MKKKQLLLLSLFLIQLCYSQTFDILKDFETNKTITYSYSKTGYGGSLPSEARFKDFNGAIKMSVDSIVSSANISIRKYFLNLRQSGIETLKSPYQTISTRDVDSVYSKILVEYLNKNHGAGENKITGWIIPDTVETWDPCSWDSTVYYKYPYYYRNYTFPTLDTFDVHVDTLFLRTQWSDCLDAGFLSEFKITSEKGLIEFKTRLFNWFGWTEIEQYKKILVTNIEDKIQPLSKHFLFGNHPNPFNSVTKIKYQLAFPGFVKLEVFDILGKKVKVLVEGYVIRGVHEEYLNAENLSSGMYIYSLRIGNFNQSRKLLILQ